MQPPASLDPPLAPGSWLHPRNLRRSVARLHHAAHSAYAHSAGHRACCDPPRLTYCSSGPCRHRVRIKPIHSVVRHATALGSVQGSVPSMPRSLRTGPCRTVPLAIRIILITHCKRVCTCGCTNAPDSVVCHALMMVELRITCKLCMPLVVLHTRSRRPSPTPTYTHTITHTTPGDADVRHPRSTGLCIE